MNYLTDILNADQNILGIEMPITVFVLIVVIIILFSYSLVKMIIQFLPIHNQLSKAIKCLNNNHTIKTGDDLKDISDQFNAFSILKNYWKEFEETLIDKNGKIYNIFQIETFLNVNNTVYPNISTNWYNTIPGILTGLGLLGTFLSLLCGLYHIEVLSNGQVQGIDGLINGLSAKFWSSIVGLLFSIVFIVIEKTLIGHLENLCSDLQNAINNAFSRFLPERTSLELCKKLDVIVSNMGGENSQVLFEKLEIIGNSISKFNETLLNLSNKEVVEQLKSLRAETKDDNKTIKEVLLSSFENINTTLNDNLTDQFKNLRIEIRDSNQEIIDILNKNFEETNRCLNEAVETLSKGATEEIIKALEQVIRDFNQNLTEQFGENFKELNNAVFKLVEWQNNYKTTIEAIESNLRVAVDGIKQTDVTLENIASKNQDIVKVCEHIGELIKTYDNQINELNQRLEDYKNLNIQTGELINEAKEKINNFEEHLNQSLSSVADKVYETQSEITDELTKMTESSTENFKNTAEESKKYLNEVSQQVNTNLEVVITKIEGTHNSISKELNNLVESNSQAIQKTAKESKDIVLDFSEHLTNNFDNLLDDFKDGNKQYQAEIVEYNKKNIDSIVQSFEKTKQSLDDISGKIQGALSSQSESMEKLSKNLTGLNENIPKLSIEIQNQLKNSLTEMGSALTTITKEFATVYTRLVEITKKLSE